jgi:hypothetical protein
LLGNRDPKRGLGQKWHAFVMTEYCNDHPNAPAAELEQQKIVIIDSPSRYLHNTHFSPQLLAGRALIIKFLQQEQALRTDNTLNNLANNVLLALQDEPTLLELFLTALLDYHIFDPALKFIKTKTTNPTSVSPLFQQLQQYLDEGLADPRRALRALLDTDATALALFTAHNIKKHNPTTINTISAEFGHHPRLADMLKRAFAALKAKLTNLCSRHLSGNLRDPAPLLSPAHNDRCEGTTTLQHSHHNTSQR